jgi:hypothetical protein
MKSSIPKNYPTSEIQLKLIPRGSYIFQKKERSVSKGLLPKRRKKEYPKLKGITKVKNRPTLV